MVIRSLRIQGNSMNRAGLLDGMVVRVRITNTAEHGDIVVVRQADDGLAVKRLYQTRPVPGFSGAWVVPDSTDPVWQPRPLFEGDRIVGVVIDLPALEESLDRPAVYRASQLEVLGFDSERSHPPPLPEDAPQYRHHRTVFGGRLMAIADAPDWAYGLLLAREAWERWR